MVDKFNTSGGDYSEQEAFLNQTSEPTAPPTNEVPIEEPTEQVLNAPVEEPQPEAPDQPIEPPLPETNLGQDADKTVKKTQETLETAEILPTQGPAIEEKEETFLKKPTPPGPGELDVKSIATSLYYEKESHELEVDKAVREQYGEQTTGEIQGFWERLWQGSGAAGVAQGVPVAAINTFSGIGSIAHEIQKLDPLQSIFDYFDPEGANFREQLNEQGQQRAAEAVQNIEEAIPTKSVISEVSAGVTKFAGAFAGVGKVSAGIKAIKTAPSMLSNMTKAGLAEFLGFDEHTQNMSDMLSEYPALKGTIVDYFSHDKGDNPFEARLKNAAEGLFGGVVGHAVFGGLKSLKKLAPRGWTKDLQPATVLDEVPDLAKKAGLTSEQTDLTTALIKTTTKEDKKSLYEMTRDTAQYLMQGAMLSSPSTHALNVASNSVVQLNSVGERVIARGLSKLGVGTRGKEGVVEGEIKAHLKGLYEGSIEGITNARNYYKTGESQFYGEGKLFAAPTLAKALGKDVNELGLAVKAFSAVADIPGKALGSSDEFFKTASFKTEMSSLLQRARVEQGLAPGAKPKLSADGLAKMVDQAKKKASYDTFTQDLGPFAGQIGKLRNALPESKFIVPFFDTLANIMTYSVDHVPLAAAMFKKNRNAFKEGGVEGVEFLSKQVMGGMYGFLGFGLYNSGILTGGSPLDFGETTTKQASGWSPYSVKAGDSYIPFDKIPGIGFVMRTTIDLIEAVEAGSELASQDDTQNMFAPAIVHYMHGVSNLMMDNSWAEGLTEFMGLLNVGGGAENVEKSYTGYLEDMALRFIPNVLKRTAMSAEDNLKEATGFIDKLKKSIPGMTSELPDAYDIYGRVKANPSAGAKALNPLRVTSEADPNSNFDKYFAERNLDLDPPRYTQSFDGIRVNLKEYPGIMSEMMRLTGVLENNKPPYGGRTLHQYLEDLVSGSEDPAFLDSNKEAQERVVRTALNSYRDLARQEILITNEEFALDIDTQKLQKADQADTIKQLMGK